MANQRRSNVKIISLNPIYKSNFNIFHQRRDRNRQKSCELTPIQKNQLKILLENNQEVSQEILCQISNSWGRKWRSYGRKLLLTDETLAYIWVTYGPTGLKEVIYQVLKTWKKETSDPSIKHLVQLLSVENDFEPIMCLLDDTSSL